MLDDVVSLDAQQVLSLPLVIAAPADVSGRHEITFVIESADGQVRQEVDSSFFGPKQ